MIDALSEEKNTQMHFTVEWKMNKYAEYYCRNTELKYFWAYK